MRYSVNDVEEIIDGLKDCPFCGGSENHPLFIHVEHSKLRTLLGRVECNNCGASALYEAWNTRACEKEAIKNLANRFKESQA